MRITSAIVALLIALVMAPSQPALAGDAETPDINDPCGEQPITSTEWIEPAADICAGWFTADLSGPAVMLEATVRTLEPSRDDLRYASISFADGDCAWEVDVSDALLTVEETTVPVGDGGVYALPDRFPVALTVECGAFQGSCTPDTPFCSTTQYERRAAFELPGDVVRFDGTDVTVTLDMAALPLEGTAVEGEAIEPGETLTNLWAFTATTAQNVFVPAGVIASASGFYVGTRTADVARGEAYTLPSAEDA